jgi:hypothetical protein
MKQFGRIFLLGAVFLLLLSTAVFPQAPPGPLTPAPPQPGSVEAAPPPPRQPEIPPRKNILGAWRFNKDESDDPRQKVKDTSQDPNSGHGGGGYGGPRIGFPGSGGPMGGGPYGGPPRSQSDDSARLGDLVNPAREIQVLRHNEGDPEVEMIDDRDRRYIFYTDGRKIEKQKEPGLQQISARWDGNRLITDETAAHNGKLSRTFEVSSDGHQLLESIRVTDSKGNHPMTINYTYDAINTSSLSFPPH